MHTTFFITLLITCPALLSMAFQAILLSFSTISSPADTFILHRSYNNRL